MQAQRLIQAGQAWLGDTVADKPGQLIAEDVADPRSGAFPTSAGAV